MKSQPDAPLLAVEHLTTVFTLGDGREAAAVNDVSFSIAKGETLALVGESGSGKSVTALSIIRLVLPPGRIASGRIGFDGQQLETLGESAMRAIRGRRIGFVFQEPMAALDPVYTIGYQIRETLAAHGLARGAAGKKRAIELLDAVRVPDPARRAREYPHQLSGGLRQRAMIALALCAEPSLLIADEPTTALDVTVQAEVLDLLRDLRRTFNLTLLLITHDLGVVAEMADRVAVMYGGRIVEDAPVRTIFSSPAHPYTRGLIACVPSASGSPAEAVGPSGLPAEAMGSLGAKAGRLVAIPGTVPALGQLPPGCAFAPRCDRRFEPCDAHEPPAVRAGDDHTVRCFLFGGMPSSAPREIRR